MRFSLIACVLFFFNYSATAQSARFLPGEITLQSGETKIGYMERTFSEKITYEVNFKENKKDEKSFTYSVNQLKSFRFKDGLKFVSEEITYATDAAGKNHITELAFLEELESGTIALLEFDNQEYRGLFLKKKDGKLELLAQQEQACADYMSILREEMADCEEIEVKEAMWFNALIIKSLIQDYNNCGKEVLKFRNGFPYKFALIGQSQMSIAIKSYTEFRPGIGLQANIRLGNQGISKHILGQVGILRHLKDIRSNKEVESYKNLEITEVWLGLKSKFSVNAHIFPIVSLGYGAKIEQDNSEYVDLFFSENFKPSYLRFSAGFQYVKKGNIIEFEIGSANNINFSLNYGRYF